MRRLGISAIVWLGVLSLGTACGDDGGTGDTENGSSSDSGGTAGMTTVPMMTSTTAGMTMTGGDSSTGEPPADSSTGEPPADSSTGEPPADSSGTAADGESSSSGGGGGAEYPPCMPDADPVCPKPYESCYEFSPPGFSVCTMPCKEAGDCPEPDGGEAVPACGGINMDTCVLDCGGDATCPDGMECQGVGGGGAGPFRCMWPDP